MNSVNDTLQLLLQFVSKNLSDFVTGASGAFLGALSAFLFEKWRDQRAVRDQQHSAIMRAQMVIIYQINSLENMRRGFLEPFRNLPNRETLMPTFWHSTNRVVVDIEALSFFLNEGRPDILIDIYLADLGYQGAVDSVRMRNDLLRDLHSTANVVGFDQQSRMATLTVDIPRAALVKDATDEMFESIDKALRHNRQVFATFRSAAKDVFPKRKFLVTEIVQDSEETETHSES
jgi:hypothetical protein